MIFMKQFINLFKQSKKTFSHFSRSQDLTPGYQSPSRHSIHHGVIKRNKVPPRIFPQDQVPMRNCIDILHCKTDRLTSQTDSIGSIPSPLQTLVSFSSIILVFPIVQNDVANQSREHDYDKKKVSTVFQSFTKIQSILGGAIV